VHASEEKRLVRMEELAAAWLGEKGRGAEDVV
jgi:hypothetical protein